MVSLWNWLLEGLISNPTKVLVTANTFVIKQTILKKNEAPMHCGSKIQYIIFGGGVFLVFDPVSKPVKSHIWIPIFECFFWGGGKGGSSSLILYPCFWCRVQCRLISGNLHFWSCILNWWNLKVTYFRGRAGRGGGDEGSLFLMLCPKLMTSPVADLRGGVRDARPPSGPKFLHFHAVFGKNWPNNRLAPPPLGLAPPPLGNPGSATDLSSIGPFFGGGGPLTVIMSPKLMKFPLPFSDNFGYVQTSLCQTQKRET